MFQVRTFEELTEVAGGPPAGSGGGVGSELVVSIAVLIYLIIGRGWCGVWIQKFRLRLQRSEVGAQKGFSFRIAAQRKLDWFNQSSCRRPNFATGYGVPR